MTRTFDFIKSINEGKDIMQDSMDEHEYSSWLTNVSFSLHQDTIFIANEINIHPNVTNRMHYKYYLSMVKPRKRWAKWPKKDKITGENIRLIQNIYKYNVSKAKQALSILTDEQITQLKELTK